MPITWMNLKRVLSERSWMQKAYVSFWEGQNYVHKSKGHKGSFWVMKVFYILIVIVTQLYIFQNSLDSTPRKGEFYCM